MRELLDNMDQLIESKLKAVDLMRQIQRGFWIKLMAGDSDTKSNAELSIRNGLITFRSGTNQQDRHYSDIELDDLKKYLTNYQKTVLVNSIFNKQEASKLKRYLHND